MTQPRFAILLPAAGNSTRFGQGDKLRSDLSGRSVLQRAVALFAQRPDVGLILIVTAPARFDSYREHLAPVLTSGVPLAFAAGGRERFESVLLGLRAVPTDIPFVAIHDAARPLTPVAVIDAAFAGAISHGGSVPVTPEPATLKRLNPDGTVCQTVDRAGLYQAQTPQCFDRAKLLVAYEKLLASGGLAGVTDDAQVFERCGLPVLGTPGSPTNLKITTAGDLEVAAGYLRGEASSPKA